MYIFLRHTSYLFPPYKLPPWNQYFLVELQFSLEVFSQLYFRHTSTFEVLLQDLHHYHHYSGKAQSLIKIANTLSSTSCFETLFHEVFHTTIMTNYLFIIFGTKIS